jgi:hypothetical protein
LCHTRARIFLKKKVAFFTLFATVTRPLKAVEAAGPLPRAWAAETGWIV